MNNFKHIFAIFGGFIGFLVSGVFFWDGEGSKVTYAFTGIAIGVMLGYFIASIMAVGKQEGFVLINKFQKLNPIQGKSIDEVVRSIGGYTSKSPITITDRNNEVGQLYKFVDGKYEVDVLVSADGICIGVLNEYLDGKKLQ